MILSTGLFENMTMEKVDDWMKRITKAGVKDIITREMVTLNE